MTKDLGKIEKAEFGFGGYQDAMLGLTLTLTGTGWGVGDFIPLAAADSSNGHVRIRKLLLDAKIMRVSQLAGTPVEVTFEKGVLKDWRVLTEVL